MNYSLVFFLGALSFNVLAQVDDKTDSVEHLRFSSELDENHKDKLIKSLQEITIEEVIDEDDEGALTRLKALKQEAYNYGLDNGIFYRGKEILELYEKHNTSLQKIFDFNRFIMNGNILLPKVSVGKRLYDQMDSKKIRRANASFKLKSEAQLVPNAPSWREYLIRYYPEPQKPHKVLLPKNKNELNEFKISFIDGWEAGVKQANMISDRDWIKLTTDYSFHLDFMLAASSNIMSYPEMTKESLAVYKTDNGKTLLVGDVIAEISTDSSFNNSSEWDVFFVNHEVMDED